MLAGSLNVAHGLKRAFALAISPGGVLLVVGMVCFVFGFYLMESTEDFLLADADSLWRLVAWRLRPFYGLLLATGFLLTASGVVLHECGVGWSALRFSSKKADECSGRGDSDAEDADHN